MKTQPHSCLKTGFFILAPLLIFESTHAQASKLAEYERRLTKQIEVGMSAEEVKKKIGRPKAVESGFPNTDSLIILDMPAQVGQLNYSTWFYFFSILSLDVPKPIAAKCFVNGTEVSETEYENYIAGQFVINKTEVSEEMYNDYKDLEEIYLVDKEIIFPVSKEYYQKEDSSTFSIQPKNHKDTYRVPRKIGKGTYTTKAHIGSEKLMFVPIFCVLFDRGTQVVASTKMMFQLVQH
jgi:hypothetical protein